VVLEASVRLGAAHGDVQAERKAMNLRLYEYAVIIQPKLDKDGETVEKGEVIVPVTTMLAKDESQVNLAAARQIPEEFTDKLDRVQVVVRPF
jgi:hypothetical protein